MHKLLRTLIVALLLFRALCQSNPCYSNCRQGYCLATDALSCTDCDLGLIRMSQRCVTSSVQPSPLRRLAPNPLNTLLDNSNQSLAVCNVTTPTGTTSRMLFRTSVGNSVTQQFTIPSSHAYLKLKFNAILLSSNAYNQQTLTLLVNVVPTNDLRNFLLSDTISITGGQTPLTCQSDLLTSTNQYGVFFLDYQFPNNQRDIIVQVTPQGLTSTFLALSAFEIYYGQCHATCATCLGPTASQCSACRGLLQTLNANGTCSDCPAAFYLDGVTEVCQPCPVLCSACVYSSSRRQVECTACLSNSSSMTFVLDSKGQCSTQQYWVSALTAKDPSSFVAGGWNSSQVLNDPVSQCGYYSLLGGLSIGMAYSFFTYSISDLSVHSLVVLRYNIMLLDQQANDLFTYQLRFDSTTYYYNLTVPFSAATNECGSQSQVEYMHSTEHTYSHTATTLTLVITPTKSYLGIRDFLLILNNPTTDPNCIQHLNDSCQHCRNNLIPQNDTCSACPPGHRLNTSALACLPCPLGCLACDPEGHCTSCTSPLTLNGTTCLDSKAALYSSEMLPGMDLSQQRLNWVFYPPLQNRGIAVCGDVQLLGTTSIVTKFLTLSRTYRNLPSHTGVTLYLTLYQIDENYLDNDQLFISVDGIKYTAGNISGDSTQLNQLRNQVCGNQSMDTVFTAAITQEQHTAATLTITVQLNAMGKVGLNNLQLYLLNQPPHEQSSPYDIELVPAYSVNTPAVQGMQVKLTFPQSVSVPRPSEGFRFALRPTEARLLQSARLMQTSYTSSELIANTSDSNRQLYYLLPLSHDYTDQTSLEVQAAEQASAYYQRQDHPGQYLLVGQQPVRQEMVRYIYVDPHDDIKDRSSIRNLYNLFRGCAILALFIGMASFLLGMSAAFDDFFLLCQLIFVHIFIQLAWNPPSLRIPFNGFSIVQFMQWLPIEARIQIEKWLIPDSHYQYTPLAFQQYFEDITFARTIYHAICFFLLMLSLWILMHIILLVYDSQHPNEKTKYNNFFVYYYKQYDSKALVMIDKIVRFAYFTIVWACLLQFLHFHNQPQGFNIWNSILCIFLFILACLYPLIMFAIVRRQLNSLSEATFNLAYEELRINRQRLFYFLVRYYKLLIVAIVIAVCHDKSPVIPLIVLIVLNLVDLALILALKPLGMVQPQLINAYLFYPHYPKVYHFCAIIQNALLLLLEILWLVLVGQRNSASPATYMGIGYAICAVVILLLLNGLLRLIWGVLRYLQYCYLQREANYMSIEKAVAEQAQEMGPNQKAMLTAVDNRTQQGALSRRDLTSRMFSNKKNTYVSNIR